MTPASGTTIRNAWVTVEHLDRAILTRPLTTLRLSARVRRACEQLGLRTLADVLGTPQDSFLHLPGVGTRSWQTLVTHVRRSLLPLTAGNGAAKDQTPAIDEALSDRFPDPRTRLALSRLGFPDRATLLREGQAALLALPGMQSEHHVVVFGDEAGTRVCAAESWWPTDFLDKAVRELGLSDELSLALVAADIQTLADLIGQPPSDVQAHKDIGPDGVAAIRAALCQTLGGHVTAPQGESPAPDGGFRRLLGALNPDERAFLEALVGQAGRPALPRARLAAQLGIEPDALPELQARCRANAHARCHALLARWRRAVDRELVAQGGAVRGERLAQGCLREMATHRGEPAVPLRLLAFLFPGELFVVGDILTTVDGETCRRAVHAIRGLRTELPKPLVAIEAELASRGLPALKRGLLLHLLHHDAHVQVVLDPLLGEVLHRRRVTVGDRVEHILRDARRSLSLADLLFRYRDRYGRARRARLLDQLWAEPRFLEIGPALWDLRERHVDQAELLEAEAARVRDTICTVGGRHEVGDLIEGGTSSERVLFLLRDRLRRDPTLRNLGRGAFCSRSLRSSTEIEALLRALCAAGGELPLDRFLSNQDRGIRNLRTRLLRESRLFVEVAKDRIDALTNYPFTKDRLRVLLRTVELHLEQHDGFDRTEGALEAVNTVGLGGDFLTPHMLRDLLVRHGRFELLTDNLIALRSRGLKAWIQQRARDAIRRAGNGLTTFEIQTEIPELAQFAACLDRVIGADPMVQSPDGLRYHVV